MTTAVVDEVAQAAVALAREVFGYAEVAREEVRSSRACAARLQDAGFDVTWGTGELDTAFRAVLDSGVPGPRVGILAEYDALPGLGHACGHNLIAGASVGAGLALARDGLERGAVEILGCPAEETGFGKRTMLQAGMIAGLDAALAVHGGPFCTSMRSSTAVRSRTYRFHGVAAHAAQSPWDGANALDAAVTFYAATSALRQHARDAERVHGFLPDGGSAYNVVHPTAAARFGVRAPTGAAADALQLRLDAAARGAAQAHGCTVSFEEDETMEAVVFSEELNGLVHEQLRAVGLEPEPARPFGASTDVGDVSEHVPTCLFFVPAWPADAQFHTPEAERASDSEAGYAAMLAGMDVLAQTTRVLLER